MSAFGIPDLSCTIAVIDDDEYDRHAPRGYHPERPERLHAARRALAASGVAFSRAVARPATRDELLRVHTSDYLARLDALRGRAAQLDPDTYVAPSSVESAIAAAGGACSLVDALVERRARRGAALVRPPGHHARPGAAMGFCLLNNVAIAAAHARARGIERIWIVDWDVHHGNGTEEAFIDDPHVLYASIHQWPFYPGTGSVDDVGRGAGRGFNVNVPLSAGAGDADYRAAFESILLPIGEQFAPEMVLISAGYDAHRNDPLAGMRLEADSYRWMTRRLVEIAERSAEGRVALVLEGGYDLPALETSIRASLQALAGATKVRSEATASPPREATSAKAAEIERARAIAAKYWQL